MHARISEIGEMVVATRKLTALAFGATVENAARKAGISERTTYYRRDDPAFQARLDQVRLDTLLRAGGMLTVPSSGFGAGVSLSAAVARDSSLGRSGGGTTRCWSSGGGGTAAAGPSEPACYRKPSLSL